MQEQTAMMMYRVHAAARTTALIVVAAMFVAAMNSTIVGSSTEIGVV